MDGLEFPFPDRRSPAPGAEGAAESPADSSSSLLEDARWVLANMPTVQLFATDTPEKEKQLKQLPAAATPQQQGQDPRVATRNFPSPWLRQPKTSPRSVGSALDRASARGKARMESGGLRRALSALSDITNAQRSSPKASPKASPKIRRALTTAAVASPKGSPGGSAGFFYREQVREGPSGAAKPSGAGGASKHPPPSPAPEAAPAPDASPAPAALPATPEPELELDATSTPSESESEKLARLEKLQAELRLLQLFSERKASAIQEGRPDSVRLSMGSVQVKADGSDEWTTVEPSVAVVEVQPSDSAKAAAPTAEEEATTPAPEDGGGSAARGGVLRPGTPSSESTPSDCAAKEQELAKLKGEHLHKTSLHKSV